MANAPKPPSGGPDIHDAIRATAERLRACKAFGIRDASEFPEAAELMDAARSAVGDAVPASFEFHGRRYYLRARLSFQMDIFDKPADAMPLLSGASFSITDHGHAPGH